MESINYFLVQSLKSEYDIIDKRFSFLSKQYRNTYNMENDFLLNSIFKYKSELKNIGIEILKYRFKSGCENFDFKPFESLYSKIDNSVNYQL